jgi:uncharacterized protein YkwD
MERNEIQGWIKEHRNRFLTGTIVLTSAFMSTCDESRAVSSEKFRDPSQPPTAERLQSPFPTTPTLATETPFATPFATQSPEQTPVNTPENVQPNTTETEQTPGSEPTEDPTAQQQDTESGSVSVSTPTQEPEQTPQPTQTPIATPSPTQAPSPTPTPSATQTPEATPTPETFNGVEVLSVFIENQGQMSIMIEDLINQERQKLGLTPLTPNQNLRNAALNYVEFLHNTAWIDYPDLTIEEARGAPIPNPHTRNGTPKSRAEEQGYVGTVSEVLGGNTLQFGLPEPGAWQYYARNHVEGWMWSEGHRNTIMGSDWSQIGAGCVLSVNYQRPFTPVPIPMYLCVAMVGAPN